jgi:hypothetical protein
VPEPKYPDSDIPEWDWGDDSKSVETLTSKVGIIGIAAPALDRGDNNKSVENKICSGT